MKKRLLFGSALSLAVLGGAFAADLPPAPPPAPAPVAYVKPPPPLTWTGCYLGGNVGGGLTTTTFFDPTLLISDGNANGSGVVGGGQVGCDVQAGPLVFGVQGMLDGTSIKGTGTQPIANSDTIPWLGTVTGRIGFPAGPTALIYAKGGGAFVQNNLTLVAAGTAIASANTTLSGWTAGAGLEWMFVPHWSFFVEYDYLGFGTKAVTFTNLTGIGPATFPTNVTQNVQMGIVGINFRF